jgi:hypothetical protein
MIDPWVPSNRRKGIGREPSQEIMCKKCTKGEMEEKRIKRKNSRRVQGESWRKELVAGLE